MAAVHSGPDRLVGRAHELQTLESFLDVALVGGSTQLLTDEPGVRKTALLSAAAEMAVARSVRVTRANGAEYVKPGVHASGISRAQRMGRRSQSAGNVAPIRARDPRSGCSAIGEQQ
jgi:hypothetical protein